MAARLRERFHGMPSARRTGTAALNVCVLLARHSRAVKTGLLLSLAMIWLLGCESAPQGSHAPHISVLDASNHALNPFEDPRAKAIVFFFLRTDCPISNRYAPEIERLAQKYASENIRFFLVYPEPATSGAEIERHRKEYHLTLEPLRDPRHALVRTARVTVTPETAVFLPDGREVYHGRIDDRYVDFGKERPEATTHDLDEALTALTAGQPIVSSVTRAVGCYIE